MNDKILMNEDKDLGWDTIGQILFIRDSRLPMLRKPHAGSWSLQPDLEKSGCKIILSSYRAQKVVQRNGGGKNSEVIVMRSAAL